MKSVLPLFLSSEPCPPENVQTNVNCQNDMGIVSWEASYGAVAYEVRLAGRDGHSVSCYSTDPFCNVEGLHCGIIYYTNVIAIGEILNSSISTTVLLISGMVTRYAVTMETYKIKIGFVNNLRKEVHSTQLCVLKDTFVCEKT